MTEQRIDLGLTAPTPSTKGCGDGCGCGDSAASSLSASVATPNDVLQVEGMTCDHCVRAVTAELSALEGLEVVWVDLRSDEPSLVRIARTSEVSDDEIAAAIDEAGYTLVR